MHIYLYASVFTVYVGSHTQRTFTFNLPPDQTKWIMSIHNILQAVHGCQSNCTNVAWRECICMAEVWLRQEIKNESFLYWHKTDVQTLFWCKQYNGVDFRCINILLKRIFQLLGYFSNSITWNNFLKFFVVLFFHYSWKCMNKLTTRCLSPSQQGCFYTQFYSMYKSMYSYFYEE